MNPPDFIIAAPPKAASTLLTRVLTQHPEVCSSHESYLITPGRLDSLATPGTDKARWHGLSEEQSQHLADCIGRGNAEGVREALCYLADHMRERTGCRVAGESWPGWSVNLDLLRRAVPESQIITMVRDPRAVWWSSYSYPREDLGHADKVDLANGQLKCLAGMDRTLASAGYAGAAIMRAEDYVEDVEGMTRELWGALGVDPDAGWFAYRTALDPEPELWGWIAGGTAQPDPERMHRWRGEIPEPICRGIERDMGAMIQRWRYPERGPAKRVPEQDVRAFVGGTSLSELPDGTEDHVREALLHARRTADAAVDETNALIDAVDEQYGVEFDDVALDDFRAGLHLGRLLGLSVANNALRHLGARMSARVARIMEAK